MKTRIKAVVFFFAGALVGGSGALAGPDWTEPPDAGSTPGTASAALGGSKLNSIAGELGNAIAGVPVDFEDMFLFRICDPELFCARTTAAFDAELWLFDETGKGLLANGSAGAGLTDAELFPPANDGTNQRIPGEGLYFLAISANGNVPLGTGLEIFLFATPEERSGPDGPGAQVPIDGWSAQVGSGPYVIFLEGAAFVDDDCTNGPYVVEVCNPFIPAVSEWGLLVLALALLACGSIVFRASTRTRVPG